ncbi:hypothetical protein MRB53_009642 [Persea americana]|uniref:Uncharacterized protein n=1 Tax=Persea americana TaxID=3435 RepID=A0ACC2LPY3_PERAE|nr:hypothetical protein MRB53_009642 [Persea americana]
MESVYSYGERLMPAILWHQFCTDFSEAIEGDFFQHGVVCRNMCSQPPRSRRACFSREERRNLESIRCNGLIQGSKKKTAPPPKKTASVVSSLTVLFLRGQRRNQGKPSLFCTSPEKKSGSSGGPRLVDQDQI